MTSIDEGVLQDSQRSQQLGEYNTVYVAEAHEIPDGEALKVISPSLPEPVAVIHADGKFYALSDTCSHGAASLSQGWVENCRVACPLHFSEFELATGKPCTLPAMASVRTYVVEVRGASIYLVNDDPKPQTIFGGFTQ